MQGKTYFAPTGLRFAQFRIPRALPWAVILLPLRGENRFIHNLSEDSLFFHGLTETLGWSIVTSNPVTFMNNPDYALGVNGYLD